MRKTRVLHILGGLESGGAESFIMNVYRKINKEMFQFDFLVRSLENDVYSKEIKDMGGKIYCLPKFPEKFFSNLRRLKLFFKKNHERYDIIHIHVNSLSYIFPFFLIKKYNIPKVIIHSHNTAAKNFIANSIHYLFRPFIKYFITKKIACSEYAGKWMYGDEDFEIINNSIDIQKFRFNKKVRENIRDKLNLKDKFVVGHVGRFVKQKNHEFILDIFQKILIKTPNAVLVLVGEGPLFNKIKMRIRSLNLENKIYLLGVRNDVNDLLQAFDIFLFPSLYEGLPFTLIEAQAAGLPCVISDNITDEVIVTNNVIKVPLSFNPLKWGNVAIELFNGFNRIDTFSLINNSKFNINYTVQKLENLYLD